MLDFQHEPSYQSIFMVVMEYVDGNMFAVAKQNMSEGLVKTVQSAVRKALKVLHSNSLVFGDLRPLNVMIASDGKVN
jgi:serine/threonine protein kinase